ncbi:MAG: SHOCT domain-containing protein [Bacteroidota bacterium]
MSITKFSIAFFFIVCFLYSYNNSFAQANYPGIKPKTSSALTKAEAEIDSLNIVITHAKENYDRVAKINKGKDSLIDELDARTLKTQALNNVLVKKLSDYKGDNLKLDQSNRILIIFNAIVGVLLLTTLIWFLRNIGRKKSPEKNKLVSKDENSPPLNIKSQASAKNDHQYFDIKLNQLEKLGVLKAKGILNDEEFNRQKQQILGSG